MKRLLIVEPSPLVRDLLKALFNIECEEGEFEVLEASDGETALGIVYTQRPALVLTEALLPRLSGVEVCRLIKEDPDYRSIPVVFVTTAVEPAWRERILNCGADGYFTKPFSPRALLEHVRELLDEGDSKARRAAG